jgi:hypothetical protein
VAHLWYNPSLSAQDKNIAMPASSAVTVTAAALALVGSVSAAQMLAPANDINLPASDTASEPLKWVGANSPWFAGENSIWVSRICWKHT